MGGGPEMSTKVLVGYATRNGATASVAEQIGATLTERGLEVNVVPVAEYPSLDGYQAVVLGSAINGGKWLEPALDFVTANQEQLRALPVAVFCVHAMNTSETPKAIAKRHAYIDSVREAIAPAEEGYFAGVGPQQAGTNAFARWMFRAFGGDVEGDGRDWDKIREWAQALSL